ncbi:zinc ABC transporter ATP-binding protein AztA [Nisaea sp.]|uniref:zinc ABC transporter ATP-binding protein AztA n=1 Tax=Nisaea sp. TaxID=2024842 RepID=UPI00326691B0
MSASVGPSISFKNLTLGYDQHPAIHQLSAVIGAGSLTALVGPNGAGKSTLLKGITKVLSPYEGRIVIDDAYSHRIAYLPQQTDIDRSFPVTVWDMVSMGLWRRIGAFGQFKRRDAKSIAEALEAVGLSGFERRSIGSLSGGQLQRMLFARLLLQDANLILLDEPFAAIDAKTAADLLALISRWHSESRTIIAVLHDFAQVRAHFPQALLLARECIASGPPSRVLTDNNLTRARQLCESFDNDAEPCSREKVA